MILRSEPPPPPELSTLRRELLALGLEEGLDFAITGWPTPVSSELYLLTVEDGDFVMDYQDMGRTREIARARSFDEIGPAFLGKVTDLAGPRGRGPMAGAPRRAGSKNWTLEEKVVEARRLGLDLG